MYSFIIQIRIKINDQKFSVCKKQVPQLNRYSYFRNFICVSVLENVTVFKSKEFSNLYIFYFKHSPFYSND